MKPKAQLKHNHKENFFTWKEWAFCHHHHAYQNLVLEPEWKHWRDAYQAATLTYPWSCTPNATSWVTAWPCQSLCSTECLEAHLPSEIASFSGIWNNCLTILSSTCNQVRLFTNMLLLTNSAQLFQEKVIFLGPIITHVVMILTRHSTEFQLTIFSL